MNLANFWKNLPGKWDFKRSIYGQIMQSGLLSVEKFNDDLYNAYEHGIYTSNKEQTFFRNYNFGWKNNCLEIHGENPKEGFVLLHVLSDSSKNHTHFCNKDKYFFELIDFSFNTWHSIITITGPKKDLTIETRYERI